MAVGSRFFLRDHDGGQTLSEKQEFALGQIGQDELGQEWSYVQFTGNASAGNWLADTRESTVSFNGTAAGFGDVGDRHGLVAKAAVAPVGAFGRSGVDGFVITGRHSFSDALDKIDVRLLYNASDVDEFGARRGWTQKPTGMSLYVPGRVVSATASDTTSDIRGVVQRDVTIAGNEYRFGWVLQKGIGACLAPGTGSGNFLNAAANGAFTRAANRGASSVARALVSVTNGQLVTAEVFIDNKAQAWAGASPKLPIGARGERIT